MLAVSPLRSSTPGERDGDAASKFLTAEDFSAEFDFDFTELFAGFGDGATVDVLPGLEMDTSEILADFPSGSEESFPDEIAAMEMEMMTEEAAGSQRDEVPAQAVLSTETDDKVSSEEEVFSASMKEEASTAPSASEVNSSPAVVEKVRKPSSAQTKSSQPQGKRRVKVDWTPELHRRFVEVVEQLGVEKAVPSRILELMGMDCLTRHNVASHLQKYRSHRKHMLAREAEAATWSQRRPPMYAAAVPATASGAEGAKREMNPWLQTPTMGFPPPAHHHPHMQTLRPLHVWGHPTADQSLVHMWPKHLFPARPAAVPSPPWMAPYPAPLQGPPPPPLPHVSPWHPHFARGAVTQGTPYFPQPLPTMRFSNPPVPGVPHHPMYRHDGAVPSASPPPPPSPGKPSDWPVQLDSHPSKESIDAAIGDVLAQPWLPLPLGLKPPSLESVMVELQKQGVSDIPPCN